MNGDLSLSQSLGGLRIANPDDDVKSGASSPPNSQYQHDSSLSAPLAQPQSSIADVQESPPLPLLESGGVDVASSLGFDPTAYTLHSPQQSTPISPPTPRFPPTDAEIAQKTLSHRQSMPIAQQAQEQPFYQSRSPDIRYHVPSPRLSPSVSMGPVPTAKYEGNYGRVKADLAPITSNDLRRSHSRAAAAAAMSGASSSRTPTVKPYPLSGAGAYPPRRSSRPSPSSSEPPQSLSRAATDPVSTLNVAEGGPLASSEEWKDKGAAVGLSKAVDKNGKTSPKIVKKGVKDFNFGRTLGEGSYSTVLAATDRQTQREYAIKVLDKRHIIKEKKVKYVNIEKDTLNRLTEHPGIVRLYYTFQDERSLYFVLDLAIGGELLGVLKKTSSFDEECSRFYAAQILDSVEYMHLRGIIHRDLKPENVLLDDQMHVKITDFGTAKILDIAGLKEGQFGNTTVSNDPMDGADTDRAVSFVGTAEYVSPELLTDKNACKASDLWAFGCIVYQLLAGRPPFKAGNEYQTFQKIVNLDYSFPDGFPGIARDLVQKLLVLDPADRLPISGIKTHKFFDSVEWGKGLWKQKPPRLRPYRPYAREPHSNSSRLTQDSVPPLNSKPSSSKPSQSTPTSAPIPSRPQPRVVTELAPPSQLDIDWSPVLNRPNERILKLGNLNVTSAPPPTSPTSRSGAAPDAPGIDTPSKFSRLFGASTTKKRQRLVMVSSAARIVLAPSGGEKKEAKQVIDLRDREVSFRSQQDAKGYAIWCVFTRDRSYTFEDAKANTGDTGLSIRSTQEWLDVIESAKEFVASQQSVATSYSEESNFNGLTPTSPSNAMDSDPSLGEPTSTTHRNILRKGQGLGDDDSIKGRKRFSKRHSKNGLAAVF